MSLNNDHDNIRYDAIKWNALTKTTHQAQIPESEEIFTSRGHTFQEELMDTIHKYKEATNDFLNKIEDICLNKHQPYTQHIENQKELYLNVSKEIDHMKGILGI